MEEAWYIFEGRQGDSGLVKEIREVLCVYVAIWYSTRKTPYSNVYMNRTHNTDVEPASQLTLTQNPFAFIN